MANKRSLLEVDETIISNNLQFQDIDYESLDSIFPKKEISELPSKLVLPTAGFCLKTLSSCPSKNKKVFINVCHTPEIPAPLDISEEELLAMWSSPEQAQTNPYRVPVSFAAPREEPDKRGVPSDVYDVAINSTFFKKVESESEVYFRTFLLQVIFEGLENKYGAQLSRSNGIILKNRKAMGTIQPQHLQIRGTLPGRNLVESVESVDTPAYTLGLTGGNLVARFHIPNIAERDVKLQLGEDRIRMEAPSKYRVDVFVASLMDPDRAEAFFDYQTDILDVTVPVLGSGV